MRAEGRREFFTFKLIAQVLRGAASSVGLLALRLREGAHYFKEDSTFYGRLVNDTIPELGIMRAVKFTTPAQKWNPKNLESANPWMRQ